MLILTASDDDADARAFLDAQGLTEREITQAIRDANRRIRDAANYNAAEELGRALTRNAFLYEAAIKNKDIKTAAIIQRDRMRLIGFDRSVDDGGGVDVAAYNEAMATLKDVRDQIAALGLSPPETRLQDMTRALINEYLELYKWREQRRE